MANVNTFVSRMIYWCRDANMGYSQADRWDFNPRGGNCDCSSLVIHALQEAGFDTGGATYTGNMSSNLTERGWARLANNGNPRPGDILLNDAHHVAAYLGDGLLAQASISERGTAYGTAGDQTGGETNIRSYYNYPWSAYLRYQGAQTPDATTEGDDMAALMIRDDDTGVVYYWTPELGRVGLVHPDQLKVLENAGVKMIHSSSKAPWASRADQITNYVQGKAAAAYCFAYTSENFAGVKFFDGHEIHPLTNVDELKALQNTYRQVMGRELPMFKLGYKSAPWDMRLEQAMARK